MLGKESARFKGMRPTNYIFFGANGLRSLSSKNL